MEPELWDLSRAGSRLPLSAKLRRAAWALAWRLLIAWTPKQFFNGWRIAVLRAFGAKIGRGCMVAGSARILQPWRLELADWVWIGEGCDIYSYDWIRIGSQSIISQRTSLCTGTHDWRRADFPLIHEPIAVGSQVWINAECFVSPGAVIEDGVILLPRSVAVKRLPGWNFCAGQPAKPIKPRPRPGSGSDCQAGPASKAGSAPS